MGFGVVGALVMGLLVLVGPVHGLQVLGTGAAHGAVGAVAVAGAPQVVGALADRLPGLPRRDGSHLDLGGVLLAKAQLVAPQLQLHGVPEGGHFDELDLCPRGEAHVDEPPFHCSPVVAHLPDHTALADGELVQGVPSCFRLHRGTSFPYFRGKSVCRPASGES